MKGQASLVGPLLQYFFVDYLCTQKRVSPQTVASYRDTFRLFLEFLQHTTGIAPTAARIADLGGDPHLGLP
jgi:site-specific recombinase XerD